MSNPNTTLSLVTPYMVSRIIKRTAGRVKSAYDDRLSDRNEYDWTARLTASQVFLDKVESLAQPNVPFIAIEHAGADYYGRKSLEKSMCPVLMAKNGFLGRFIIASYKVSAKDQTSLKGVLYEDRTKSHQDSLIRTKIHVQSGDIFNQIRFPDVLTSLDTVKPTDEIRQSSPLSTINLLTELVACSVLTSDPQIIANSLNQYSQRVNQYNGQSTTQILPFIPRQANSVDQLNTTSEALTYTTR